MKPMTLAGILGAVAIGVVIGLQASISNRGGALVGPVRTGLVMNMMGGGIALVLVLGVWLFRRETSFDLPPTAVKLLFLGGLMGVFIVMGVSASLQLSGLTAGIAALILGQMLIGTILDAQGWGGVEAIPVSPMRIAGLAVMALAVYLLLPKA
jgi:transporter family-2 protein